MFTQTFYVFLNIYETSNRVNKYYFCVRKSTRVRNKYLKLLHRVDTKRIIIIIL